MSQAPVSSFLIVPMGEQLLLSKETHAENSISCSIPSAMFLSIHGAASPLVGNSPSLSCLPLTSLAWHLNRLELMHNMIITLLRFLVCAGIRKTKVAFDLTTQITSINLKKIDVHSQKCTVQEDKTKHITYLRFLAAFLQR